MSESNSEGSSRLDHEGQVLQALRQSVQLSQPTLARKTGLARGTVVNIVRKLEEKELVASAERPPGPNGGRPGKVVWLRDNAGFGLAVHFGHRHVRVACGDLRGYQVFFFKEESVSTEAEVNVGANGQQSLEVAVGLVGEALKNMRDNEGRDLKDLVAVTVGWPAPVTDVETGEVVIDDSMTEWLGMGRPAEKLQGMLGWSDVPFLTENDAHLAALMELEHGIGREHEDFLYIHWNSGVGGALVSGRQLQRGATGLGGEFGHIPLSDEGQAERCLRCGSDHCLEVLAGGTAVVEHFNAQARGREAENLRDVIDRARGNGMDSESARETLKNAARLIGKALGPILTANNPTAIVIGGHLGEDIDQENHHSLIAEAFRSSLREHASIRAMKAVRSIDASGWRYGAAQGGVVLGMRKKLKRLAEVRERQAS